MLEKINYLCVLITSFQQTSSRIYTDFYSSVIFSERQGTTVLAHDSRSNIGLAGCSSQCTEPVFCNWISVMKCYLWLTAARADVGLDNERIFLKPVGGKLVGTFVPQTTDFNIIILITKHFGKY